MLGFTAAAQSTFRLQNFDSFASIDAPVFDAQGVRLAGPIYVAELWGGVASVSLSPTLDFDSRQRVFVPFDTGPAAGYFSSFASMTVFGAPAGDFAWVQVRAWDVRLAGTYEEVAALGVGGYGESPMLHLIGGSPDVPTLPARLVGLESFNLRPVIPEPSTWALLTLSGTALWWGVRRRRV